MHLQLVWLCEVSNFTNFTFYFVILQSGLYNKTVLVKSRKKFDDAEVESEALSWTYFGCNFCFLVSIFNSLYLRFLVSTIVISREMKLFFLACGLMTSNLLTIFSSGTLLFHRLLGIPKTTFDSSSAGRSYNSSFCLIISGY